MLHLQDKLRFLTFPKQTFFSFSLGVLSLLLVFPFFPTPPNRPEKPATPVFQKIQKPTITSKVTKAQTQVQNKPQSISQNKLLIGMGSEADGAIETKLVKETSVRMLSSWYNKPEDLNWMTGWKNNLVPDLYAKGYALHLITFSDYPEMQLQTPYGPACGREYPLSPRFVSDMRQLAETFKGSGPLYVTLFTEFQTYPCTDNTWLGSENYYKTLKDQYRAARKVFKEIAPNAQVAISWGGWQSRWDDTAQGSGRSLFPYFADIMKESDFTAFQAMESGTNVQDIKDMSKILGGYKKPVMLSHYKPDNGSQTTFDVDTRTIFTDAFMAEVTANGLFAFSFMDNVNLNNSSSTYDFMKSSVNKYGK